jgi:NADH:ubiquinone oxidoreductase subunit 6 (subunit J)
MNTLFYTFSVGSLLSAIIMVRAKNPIHSVFYLILTFLNCSGLFCLLGLEYFALVNLLVYVGALAILFLFVVMLLNISLTEIIAHQRGTYPIASLFLALLILLSLFALLQPTSNLILAPLLNPNLLENSIVSLDYNMWGNLNNIGSNVKQLGVALYTLHTDLLIIASLLLLVAIVGAVALTLKRRAQAPQQDVFVQHNRDFQKIIVQVQE